MDDDRMSREEIIEKFSELEDKYKTECSPEGIQNILGIYDITQTSDLIPVNIFDKYREDNKNFCILMRDWKLSDDPMESAQINEIEKRMADLQSAIFHSQKTIMSFMAMTNINLAFPTPKTPDHLYRYCPLDTEDMKPIHILLIFLLNRLYDERYRRCGSMVMEQVFTSDGKPTHSWKEKCEISYMMRIMCNKENVSHMWKLLTAGNFDSVEKYLKNCCDQEFPDLIVKPRVWSFKDGIYDASNDMFKFYSSYIDPDLVACKMIDMNFADSFYKDSLYLPDSPRKTYDDIETPVFDSIFEPQKWDKEMIKWLFVFIGRLFYRVGEKDSFQVIPYILGAAGNGKSTIIKVIQMMYAPRDIGIISNHIEKTFGLSSICDKHVFLIPEAKRDFALNPTDFQSMVTGEEMSMPVKNKDPIVKLWDVPGMIVGNEMMGYEDKSGSICRRIVIFDFPNKIPLEKLDPGLLGKIKNQELPSIIRKASLAYDWAIENYSKGDIWTALPERILVQKKKLMYSSSALFSFLQSSSVEIDSDEYTLESTFIVALKAFTALRFPGVSITFTEEFYGYIFSDFDLKIENSLKAWPIGSSNFQKQSYVLGCRVIE